MRFASRELFTHTKKHILVAVVALATIHCGLTASAIDFGKIMPLGDSITAGTIQYGSYRAPLCEKMLDAGHDFQFTGSLWWSYNQEEYQYLVSKGQYWYEGHGGYRIVGNENMPGISENLEAWIGPEGTSPDTILLMIGTNEMVDENPTVTIPQHLDDLIGDIYDYLPNVELFVSSILRRPQFYEDNRVEIVNATIPGIVANYESQGKNIHFVDIYPLVPEEDLFDTVHTDTAGNDKIADAWLNALEGSVPEPGSVTLLLMGIAGLSAGVYCRKIRR